MPLQAPEAVHELALLDDQINVDEPPTLTLVGLADSETVGAGVGLGLGTVPPGGVTVLLPFAEKVVVSDPEQPAAMNNIDTTQNAWGEIRHFPEILNIRNNPQKAVPPPLREI